MARVNAGSSKNKIEGLRNRNSTVYTKMDLNSVTFPEVLSQFPRLVFSSSKRMIPAVELVEAYCKTMEQRNRDGKG